VDIGFYASAASAARTGWPVYAGPVRLAGFHPMPSVGAAPGQSRMLSQRCLAYAKSRAGLRYRAGNASPAPRLVKQTSLSLGSFFGFSA
jgi:hypothetical protein